jgi:cell division protein FtsL
MTFLLSLIAAVLMVCGYLFYQYRDDIKKSGKTETLESEVKARDTAIKARERLRRDADYAQWVRDEFTRD